MAKGDWREIAAGFEEMGMKVLATVNGIAERDDTLPHTTFFDSKIDK